MPSRFGLKDLVFLLLLAAVGVSIWLKMVQDDRAWRKLSGIEARLSEIEQRLGELRAAPQATPQAGAAPVLPAARDESWAVPGVPIAWQPPAAPTTDPRSQPGFGEGGEFCELLEADPANITPYFGTSSYARRVMDLVCEPLAGFDPRTLELRGVLAAAWQIDPDGRWIRVRLRDDAVFADGTPVTAADVEWTLEGYIRNARLNLDRYRAALEVIESCRAVGPRCVEYRFKERYYQCAETALTLWVLPRAFYEALDPEQINLATGLLMGSGPFRLAGVGAGGQWQKGTPVILERNPRYWGPRPPLERIRFNAARDDVARLASYRKGEADMFTPAAAQFKMLRDEPGFADEHVTLQWLTFASGTNVIVWNCGTRKDGGPSPFADPRVRRAMTMLLDRDFVLAEMYEGVGVVPAGPFNPVSPLHNPELRPVPFDLEQARVLLSEAGWQDRDGDGVLENGAGERFDFEFKRASTADSDRRIAAYLADQCRKVKIVCRDVPLEPATLFAAARSHDFGALRIGLPYSSPEPDPKSRWHSESINGGDNIMAWANPEADRLIDAARAELDGAKRAAQWRRLEALIAEEQPCTFLRLTPWVRVHRKHLGNVQPYPGGLVVTEFFRRSTGGGQ